MKKTSICLGSVRLVVDVATGTIAQEMRYDEFGRVTLDTSPGFQPFGFAGGLYDSQTGLVRFGARDYDAQSGRWTGSDPAGLAGSGETNLFRYSLNNPINYTDPVGQIPLPLITGAIGAVGGAIGSAVGQVIVNGGFDNFSVQDVGIAAGVGFVAGAVAPILATSTLGAAALGGLANGAQYGLTEVTNGREISLAGLALSVGTGAVAGGIAGPVSRAGGVRFDEASVFMGQQARAAGRIVNEARDAAANLAGSNLARSGAASLVSNAPISPADLVGPPLDLSLGGGCYH